MNFNETSEIITKKVLNESTGELESKDFKSIKKTKRIKGGFHMSYKSYEEVQRNVVFSNNDIKILTLITNQFTYQRVETSLPAEDISKTIGCSRPVVTKFIKRLVEADLLKRVTRGIYRLNPYMYLPFRADGEALQEEWTRLSNQ